MRSCCVYASGYPPKKAKVYEGNDFLSMLKEMISSKLEEINTKRKGNSITDDCGKRGRKSVKRMDQV